MKKRIKDLTEEEIKGLEDKAYKFEDSKGEPCLITKSFIIDFLNSTIDIPDKHILDKQEHDYLRAVCKPFEVVSICKNETWSGDEWITIYTKSRVYFGSIASWLLPVFTKDTMYKGMEVDKEYTIKDLELDKEWEE